MNVVKIGNTNIDLNSLKGMGKREFCRKYKAIFANPEKVYESIESKIPKAKRSKKVVD